MCKYRRGTSSADTGSWTPGRRWSRSVDVLAVWRRGGRNREDPGLRGTRMGERERDLKDLGCGMGGRMARNEGARGEGCEKRGWSARCTTSGRVTWRRGRGRAETRGISGRLSTSGRVSRTAQAQAQGIRRATAGSRLSRSRTAYPRRTGVDQG